MTTARPFGCEVGADCTSRRDPSSGGVCANEASLYVFPYPYAAHQ